MIKKDMALNKKQQGFHFFLIIKKTWNKENLEIAAYKGISFIKLIEWILKDASTKR